MKLCVEQNVPEYSQKSPCYANEPEPPYANKLQTGVMWLSLNLLVLQGHFAPTNFPPWKYIVFNKWSQTLLLSLVLWGHKIKEPIKSALYRCYLELNGTWPHATRFEPARIWFLGYFKGGGEQHKQVCLVPWDVLSNYGEGCKVGKRSRKRAKSEVKVTTRWTAQSLGFKEGVCTR